MIYKNVRGVLTYVRYCVCVCVYIYIYICCVEVPCVCMCMNLTVVNILDFSQRWCCLGDGMFSYFKSEQSHHKCGGMKTSEIICLSVNSPGKHG